MRIPKHRSFNTKVFAKRLEELRAETGVTQKDFAENIDRTRPAYVVIAQGKIAPSADCLVDIVNFLKKKGIVISMDYLFGLSDQRNSTMEMSKKLEKLENESLREINALQKQLLGKK